MKLLFVKYCDAFNFGPLINSNKEVAGLVEAMIENWGGGDWYTEDKNEFHEASLLNLSIEKAYHLLNWYPVWGFEKTIKATVEWYKCSLEKPENLNQITSNQILDYLR